MHEIPISESTTSGIHEIIPLYNLSNKSCRKNRQLSNYWPFSPESSYGLCPKGTAGHWRVSLIKPRGAAPPTKFAVAGVNAKEERREAAKEKTAREERKRRSVRDQVRDFSSALTSLNFVSVSSQPASQPSTTSANFSRRRVVRSTCAIQ